MMKPVEERFHVLLPARDFPTARADLTIQALAMATALTGCSIRLSVMDANEALIQALQDSAQQHRFPRHALTFSEGGKWGDLEAEWRSADLLLDLTPSPEHDRLVHAFETGTSVIVTEPPPALPADAYLTVKVKKPADLAAVLAVCIENPRLRRLLVKNGLKGSARRTGFHGGTGKDFCIEGPFDTSYSLALVNRYAAQGLAEIGKEVALRPTEATGPYQPDRNFLDTHPSIAALVENRESPTPATTVLRNMYPLRLSGMHGINNGLCCYGWEESRFPGDVAADMNRHLHLVCTTSEYVTRTLADNGVYTPLFSVGDGADHILSVKPDQAALPHLGKGLRFLHISSCFPRKGIDILLDAYGTAFTGDDDVRLVIKTFPNPHHDIEALLENWRRGLANPPDIVLINEDLDDGAIRALYQQCDVLVAPSRGEGFGLPMAEAMLHDMPVITTGYGGQRDFCREDTAWLIRYTFVRAKTHMELTDSVWAEPDTGHLADLLTRFYIAAREQDSWLAHTEGKTRKAKALVSSRYSWAAVAQRIDSAVASLDRLPALMPRSRRGVVTTWNSKCGIAAYSRHLLTPSLDDAWILANDNAELVDVDGPRVRRCWTEADPGYPQRLFDTIRELKLDQVLIQFNFGFFSRSGLGQLLRNLHGAGIQTFITFHATAGKWSEAHGLVGLEGLAPELARVNRIFVHSVPDLNRMKGFGLVDNVYLFPHGVTTTGTVPTRPRPGKLIGRQVIASYGFLLPHKGILPLIEALPDTLAVRPDTHLLLVNACYPSPLSTDYKIACQNQIRRLGLENHVTLITDFLEDDDSLAWLNLADMLVFPYQHTLESSSAAIRWGLSVGKPVYCTPLEIFDDVSEAVTYLPGTSPREIAEGLISALEESPTARESLRYRQAQWLREHDWVALSQRLRNLMRAEQVATLLGGQNKGEESGKRQLAIV